MRVDHGVVLSRGGTDHGAGDWALSVQFSDAPEMVLSNDSWKPLYVGEMEVSWETALRQKGTVPSGRWKK